MRHPKDQHRTRPGHHHTPFDPFGRSAGPDWGKGLGGRHGRRGRGRGRSRRGDIRAAIIALLAEADAPMHGYEMIREISDRSGGFWKPSPGSIYPTLQLLADENLIANVGGKSGKRLFELTDTGRATAAELGDIPPWEQVANHVDPDEVEFREAGGSLLSAMRQVSAVATPAQKAKASAVLNEARSSLYAILGELDSPSTSDSDKD